jgi:hypothetical protein
MTVRAGEFISSPNWTAAAVLLPSLADWAKQWPALIKSFGATSVFVQSAPLGL